MLQFLGITLPLHIINWLTETFCPGCETGMYTRNGLKEGIMNCVLRMLEMKFGIW